MKISVKNRKIGYTYGSVSGVYSFRNEKMIQHESLLEKDFIHLMNFNDTVIDITEQPFTIEYQTKNGKTSTYTPDFLVQFKQPNYIDLKNIIKPLLVEVKPNSKIKENWSDLKPKFKQAIKFCSQNKYRFKIFNEERIRSQELTNIVFLSRYQDYKTNHDDIDRILKHLKLIGHTTIEYLIAHLFTTELQRGIGLSHIWFLINSKIISCNLNHKLTNSTVIWLCNNENEKSGVQI